MAALIPVAGFIPVGFMQYSPVSNHFAHLALAGACAFLGWIIAQFFAVRRWSAGAAAALIVLLFTALSLRESGTLRSAQRLYQATLAANPSSWLARTNLGLLYQDAGDLERARRELESARALEPSFAPARNDLGNVLYLTDDLPGAIAEYRAAIHAQPNFPEAHNDLGAALARTGRLPEAIAEFQKAVDLNPAYESARLNLAKALKGSHTDS